MGIEGHGRRGPERRRNVVRAAVPPAATDTAKRRNASHLVAPCFPSLTNIAAHPYDDVGTQTTDLGDVRWALEA